MACNARQLMHLNQIKIRRMNCRCSYALIVVASFVALLSSSPVRGAEVPVAHVSACPGSFNGFLERFAADQGFRAQHTESPLTYLRPRGRKMETMRVVPAVKAHYPGASFPSDNEQATMQLERHISATASGTYTVTLSKDVGYDRTFVFRQTQGCWRLTEVRNAVPL